MNVSYIVEKCWCNSEKAYQVYDGEWYGNSLKIHVRLGMCVKCGTIRTIYASNNSHVEYDETSVYTDLSYRHIKSLETITKFIKKGNLLEIGCSSGLVLKEIRNRRKDVEVMGIDLNKKALENSVDKNLNLVYSDIEGLHTTFNNIVLMHVIEHIPDLNSFFNKLMNLAKKDTIVYFSLPNIQSFNFRRNKEIWGALNPMEHTWHFSKETYIKVIKHFLPDSQLLCFKTSWVWKPRLVGFLGNILLEGDQLEFVVKI